MPSRSGSVAAGPARLGPDLVPGERPQPHVANATRLLVPVDPSTAG